MGWHGPGAGTIWKMTVLFLQLVSLTHGKRHVVYWNSTNTRLSQGDLSIDVDPGDYLDIFCPTTPGAPPRRPRRRWCCTWREGGLSGLRRDAGATALGVQPARAPLGPVRFTEKIQRFTPFSTGFEFRSGYHYYYSSLATKDGPELPCMKLRVAVCCGTEPTEVLVVLRQAY
ncbi:hypothetical protein ANANG_G00182130 [Anguilla anguilla]|uniref:Ephrin RBD domain-containing protein n=1 Tax=Anguilla anguilla TaxID=7936 RepID=A0A9D3M5F7_ANGAN|nr:hypothetical protein ANANG_G00182130 [Anguilla anguilla]